MNLTAFEYKVSNQMSTENKPFFHFRGCSHKIYFLFVYVKMCKIGGMTFLMVK